MRLRVRARYKCTGRNYWIRRARETIELNFHGFLRDTLLLYTRDVQYNCTQSRSNRLLLLFLRLSVYKPHKITKKQDYIHNKFKKLYIYQKPFPPSYMKTSRSRHIHATTRETFSPLISRAFTSKAASRVPRTTALKTLRARR